MINLEETENIIKILKQKIQDKFPGEGFTVFVTLWQDNTYKIVCRSAKMLNSERVLMRDYIWYDGNIEYKEEEDILGL